VNRLKSILTLAGFSLLLACGGGSSSGNGGSTPSLAGSVTVTPPNYTGYNFWVACQDGDGPWTLATASSGSYTFNVANSAGRYGVVLVAELPNFSGGTIPNYVSGSIYHLTRAEVTRVDLSGLLSYSTASVSGLVSGTTGTDTVSLKIREMTQTLLAGTSNYTFNAPMGQANLLAIRRPNGGMIADRLIVSRKQTISGPGTLPTLDFNSGWTLLPQASSASGAVSGETVTSFVNWITPTTFITLATTSTSTLAFNAVPVGNQEAEDFHVVGARADSASGWYRLAGYYSKPASGFAITLPPAVTAPALGSAGSSPYYRPTLTWAPLPGTQVMMLTARDTTSPVQWMLTVSAGWLAGKAAPSYSFPDLSTLAGWKNAWGFTPGHTISWNYTNRWTSTVDPGFFTGVPRSFKEGISYWYSAAVGTAVAAPSTPAAPATPSALPLDLAFHHQTQTFLEGPEQQPLPQN
jgi:hypothetical protein